MRYTELTKKELQREYTKLTRRYTDFVREPLELDMTAEDIFGKSESRRAARHFGTVLGKELSDTGAAQPAPVEDAVAAVGEVLYVHISKSGFFEPGPVLVFVPDTAFQRGLQHVDGKERSAGAALPDEVHRGHLRVAQPRRQLCVVPANKL